MTRRLVDCGFIIAVLDRADDGKPMLTLLQPGTDDTEGQTMVMWDVEGLENLREALADYLDEWAANVASAQDVETEIQAAVSFRDGETK